jgi:transcriptional regulator with XRE-family HTH domain
VITCVGQQIQKAMAKKPKITSAKLARLTGIDPGRLGLILREDTRPSMAEVERIARVLCIKVSFLLQEVDEERPVKSHPNPELIKLLEDGNLALNFRLLGELDDKEQGALIKVIQGLIKRKEVAAEG